MALRLHSAARWVPLLLATLTSVTHADAPPDSPTTTHRTMALWESPRERDRRIEAELEAALAESLTWLTGVAGARVHLSGMGTRASGQAPAAAILLETGGPPTPPGLSQRAAAVVLAAVPQLKPTAVTVTIRQGTPGIAAIGTPTLQTVGPFQTTERDAPRLRVALAGLLLLNGLLAFFLIALWRRLRHGSDVVNR